MEIFRSYDIRGLYPENINEVVMEKLGRTFADFIQRDCIVARDARKSGLPLEKAFVKGFLESGNNVMIIGILPIGPACYWSTTKQMDLVYITASHLPEEWNGVKLYHWNGLGYLEPELIKIKEKIDCNHKKSNVRGVQIGVESQDVREDYSSYIAQKTKAQRKVSIVIDCCGATETTAKQVFDKAGFNSFVLTGRNELDPNAADLAELKKAIKEKKADMGIAYDADGDRLVVFDEIGQRLTPEQVAGILIRDVKSNKPIVANVECSGAIDKVAADSNSKIIRVRVGHTWVSDAVVKHNACLAVESSGHFVVPSIVPFHDTIAVSAYLASVFSKSTQNQKLSESASQTPYYPTERINFSYSEEKRSSILEKLNTKLTEKYKDIDKTDGLCVNMESGRALIRASNTEPKIRLTVEANDHEALSHIKKTFTDMVNQILI